MHPFQLSYEAIERNALRALSEDEPALDPRFQALNNVLLSPHQGSATHETRAAMARLTCDNIAAFRDGKPLLTPVATG